MFSIITISQPFRDLIIKSQDDPVCDDPEQGREDQAGQVVHELRWRGETEAHRGGSCRWFTTQYSCWGLVLENKCNDFLFTTTKILISEAFKAQV